MTFRFARVVAISLILLGASPFTAPFSTCDLGTLHGSTTTSTGDQSADDMWQASPDIDKTPVVALDYVLPTARHDLARQRVVVFRHQPPVQPARFVALRI